MIIPHAPTASRKEPVIYYNDMTLSSFRWENKQTESERMQRNIECLFQLECGYGSKETMHPFKSTTIFHPSSRDIYCLAHK
jgi:hypothetical protein